MMKKALIIAALTIVAIASSNAQQEIVTGSCTGENFIVVYARTFAIDQQTQRPIGDTGRFVVLGRGQSYKGWKLDHWE